MIDLHCDTLSVLYENGSEGLRKNNLAIDLEKLKKAGATAQFFACFVDMKKFNGADKLQKSFSYALDLIRFGKKEFQKENDLICQANNYEEYAENLKKEKISAFLTVEEGGIIGEDIAKLNKLYSEGVRLVTLCWNYENSIGYPNSKTYEIMRKGLKKFGFNVIEQMNKNKMIIDVSHLSYGGFFDVLSASKTPVIASHSSAGALCFHPRNLTDEMIKALANKGGICGVNYYPFFLNLKGEATLQTLAEHIKYMINKGGENFVALGSDFDGFSKNLPMLEDISKTERLFHALKKLGINETQLEKLKITNAERIIKEIL